MLAIFTEPVEKLCFSLALAVQQKIRRFAVRSRFSELGDDVLPTAVCEKLMAARSLRDEWKLQYEPCFLPFTTCTVSTVLVDDLAKEQDI